MIDGILMRPIKAAARRHGLEAQTVATIVHIESSGRRHAWRPEPPFRYLVDVRTGRPFRDLTPAERASEIAPPDFPYLGDSRNAEWWGQQASWGLMQVMGAVARECGFKGRDFPELCEVELGLEYGCAYLARQARRFQSHGGLDAIAAYNGGSPRRTATGELEPDLAAYVSKFEAARRLYQGV